MTTCGYLVANESHRKADSPNCESRQYGDSDSDSECSLENCALTLSALVNNCSILFTFPLYSLDNPHSVGVVVQWLDYLAATRTEPGVRFPLEHMQRKLPISCGAALVGTTFG